MNLSQFAHGDKFLMLALDHRESFKKLVSPTDPNKVSDTEVIDYKHQIIEATYDQFSSLLIDVEYGLKAYSDFSKPYLLPLERSGFIDRDGQRLTEIDYSVSKLKALGANGAKLLIYLDPHGRMAEKQIQTAKSLDLQAKALGFPFFLELVTYHTGTSYEDKEKLIFDSLKQLLEKGVKPDVFKLEYPGHKVACTKITELIDPIPWVLLSGGKDFTTFCIELREAITAGASGFLAGRTLWQDLFKLNRHDQKEFLAKVLPARFKKLATISLTEHPNNSLKKKGGRCFDIAVIGGGPAGIAAGIFSARKGNDTVLITDNIGGQALESDQVRNWIGEENITGSELMAKLEKHLRSQKENLTILTGERISKVELDEKSSPATDLKFYLKTEEGKIYMARSVILATGSSRRHLDVPGENQLLGRGVSFCTTCDAPLFKNKKVAVIGGGNAGLEAVRDLLVYVDQVTLVEKSREIRGDRTLFEKIKDSPKLKEVILNAQIIEILGKNEVKGIRYKNIKTGKEEDLTIDGVFVEIGLQPNSELARGVVKLDQHNQIVINFKHATTSHPGIFAAGDVTDDPYKQNNIATGDGVRAALAAHSYLQNQDKVPPSEA